MLVIFLPTFPNSTYDFLPVWLCIGQGSLGEKKKEIYIYIYILENI